MSLLHEESTLHVLLHFAVGLISLALVFGTVIPFIRSNEWWIRVFDFPRMQIVILIFLSLVAYALLRLCAPLRTGEYMIAALLGLAMACQLYSIAPYTLFYPHQMAQSRYQENSGRISLLAYNVLSDNREVEALRDLIQTHNPDVILLSETTQWWLERLDGLQKDYPYTVFQPQENDYGILLYSKLELEGAEVRFLIEPGIPSIRTHLRLRSGQAITLYGVHPRPPGIKRPEEKGDDDSEREDSDMRDAELLLVAKEISKLGDVPVIVAGDFNDVAWSHTTHLFQQIGGLLDPRIGRGLFNTFDASKRFMRYPLDHVFASEHFLLVELRRLPNIGSDHFPVLVILDYDPNASAANDEPQADAGDRQEAQKAIEEGKTD